MKQADKVFVTLEGTSSLSTTDEFIQTDENEVDGVVFSKSDITFNGTGTLNITSTEYGIVSKDDLIITGGKYVISSTKDALSGKDSVRIADGEFEIVTGGGSVNAVANTNDSFGGGEFNKDRFTRPNDSNGEPPQMPGNTDKGQFQRPNGDNGEPPQMPENTDNGQFRQPNGDNGEPSQMPGTVNAASVNESQTEEDSDDSAKAVKSKGYIYIAGGSFTIDSKDDAIHANDTVVIDEGTFTIQTGDDAIHADKVLTINNGTVDIISCYEGLEAQKVTINGGVISLTASDDGINASDGSESMMFGNANSANATPSETQIVINGGSITVNAKGDGIDSNGDFYVTGGTTIIYGPEDGANGALDYDNLGQITGGSIIAIGSSGMAMSFGNSSTQASMFINLDSTQQAGTEITLTDADGKIIIQGTSPKSYNSVVISSPSLSVGGTYILNAGTESKSITLDSVNYSTGASGFGMNFGGGFPGFKGNR